MPANNRVHSSAALQTHGIWQSAIGYDPYAPEKDSKAEVAERAEGEGRAENAYASFQGLLALARITGSSANDTRGACKKCGRVGHLTYQCRNFLSAKDKESDDVARQNAAAVFDRIKKANGLNKGENDVSSSEEEESESSDSDVDPELERIIAARMGKSRKAGKDEKYGKDRKVKRSGHSSDDEDDDEVKTERKRTKEKKHKRKRSSSDEKKKKRRRRDGSSDDGSSEEEERRRRHRKSKKEKRSRRRRRESSEGGSEDSADGHRHSKRKEEISDGEYNVSPKRNKHLDRRRKAERHRD